MRSVFVAIPSSLRNRSAQGKLVHQLSRRWVNHSRTGKARLCVEHAEFLDLVGEHGDGEIKYRVIETSAADSRAQVVELTLCNEKKKNAISGRMMAQLADYLDSLLLDHERQSGQLPIMGLILRGQGGAFCAGADLTLVKEVVNTSERGLLMSRFMTDALTRLRQSRLVSVALLEGPAVGGGAELCTSTDFRLMVDDPAGKNHVCFIHAKIGASPGWGGAYRLQSIVGRSNALLLLGTSQRVPAQQAAAMGLVDQIVPPTNPYPATPSSSSATSTQTEPGVNDDNDVGLQAALRFLQPFTSQPYPDAVGDLKAAVAQCEYASADDARQYEHHLFGRRWGSKDNKQALRK